MDIKCFRKTQYDVKYFRVGLCFKIISLRHSISGTMSCSPTSSLNLVTPVRSLLLAR